MTAQQKTTNRPIQEEAPKSAIKSILDKALNSTHISHGSFRLEIFYRDKNIIRYSTTWEQSYQI